MIWLILFVVGLMLLIIQAGLGRVDSDSFVYGVAIMIISGNVFSFFFFDYIDLYPNLNAQLGKVRALESRIETERNACYSEESQEFPNVLVKGSLIDVSQSIISSQYAKQLAKASADYQSKLEYYRSVKSSTMLYWFGGAMYISNRIFELPDIYDK